MVDNVEPAVEEQEPVSHEDAFNQAWGDAPEADPLDEPIVETGDNVPEVKEPTSAPTGAVESEPELEEEPQQVERPPIATRDPYAWIEGLPEEQKEMANRLKHEALSDRGRVSALTRQNEEIKTKLAQAHSVPVAPASEEASAPNAQATSDSLRQLQEDYPELGKQLSDIYAEQAATLQQQFSDQLKPIQEARTADAQASEQARLEEAAADIFNTKETGTHWQDVVKSEDFTAWLGMQPKFIQDTASTSNDAQDGIDVLTMYESDYQAALAAQNATADVVVNEDATQRGDQLKAQRQQRKATTVSPASKPAGTDTEGTAGDYVSEFNARWGSK